MAVISGGNVVSPVGTLLCETATFTETDGSGVYTASVSIPGNSWLLDLKFINTALWDNAGTAVLKAGDATTDDGWFTNINLKATDLIAGTNQETLDFNNAGGKPGGFIVAVTGERARMYVATARLATGIVTTSSTGGSAGRTRMLAIFTSPTVPTVATYVAT
jgi:hypothetical protein